MKRNRKAMVACAVLAFVAVASAAAVVILAVLKK